MQIYSFRYLVATLVGSSFLLVATPGRAQYAFHRVEAADAPGRTATEAPKPGPYRMVRGVVQGAAGALPGATVMLLGGRTVAVTNAEGEFELRVPADAQRIKIVCGYGGLLEETLTLAPVQALGSIYLLRTGNAPADASATAPALD